MMHPQHSSFQKPSPILFIGLDALDWELISLKITEGKLPHLANLLAQGTGGPLRSIHPLFSPALWSTIATGKPAYEHGVTGFTLPDDEGRGLRPYDSKTRCVPAFWNILSAAGKTSHIINWWNTAPTQPIQGVMVDETFCVAQKPASEPWNSEAHAVFPASFAPLLEQERIHPQQLPERLLHQLVPKLYEIDPHTDLRIAGIAKVLAEDLTTLQVTLRLMRETSWDLTSLYLIGLDSLAHLSMVYRTPVTPGLSERDYELYGNLIDHAYDLYDQWVGTLVAAAGKETTILLISDHGFYHDHRKPKSLGIEATAPCAHHSPIGSLIMAGPSIQKGKKVDHATILDICPTLLFLAGIPIGKDMPGKILSEAFCQPIFPQRVPSWDPIYSVLEETTPPSLESTQAALRQLVALGYLPELPDNQQSVIEEAYCDQHFHRALSYLHYGHLDRAIELLEQARLAINKTFSARSDILGELAFAYLLVGKPRTAAANLYYLIRERRRDALMAQEKFLLKAATANPDRQLSFSEVWELRTLLARASLNEEALSFIKALARELTKPDEASLALLCSIAKKHPEEAFFSLYAGLVNLTQDREEEGNYFLRHVASLRPEEAEALSLMATYKNKKGAFEEAASLAQEALLRNPLHTTSWLALATAHFHQKLYKQARHAALCASKSMLHKSDAYSLLALIMLEEKKDFVRARRYRLLAQKAATILEKAVSTRYSKKTTLAEDVPVKKRASENIKNSSPSSSLLRGRIAPQKEKKAVTVIIVTGLPRSGTSLLMQMLAAGGIPITTDHERSADEHNPQGYFEHEKAKTIEQDAHFLKEGEASKIVIPLLWKLPKHHSYKIIFIRRPLEEVVESQQRMAPTQATGEELKEVYHFYENKTLEWLHEHAWPVLELHHGEVIADPQKTAEVITAFLEQPLNQEAMAKVVIPSLHRIRK